MNEKQQQLYSEMLEEINRSQQAATPESERVTAGFWIACNYWERLKETVNPLAFSNDGEEIYFFRNVKPRFTAHIEYFTLLSEALICVPARSIDAIDYWEEEAKRLKRFCARNEEFVTYYESSGTNRDSLFFLRRNNKNRFAPKLPVYDMDEGFYTSYGHLLRSYLANKMYWDYTREKISQLTANL